MGGGPPAEGAGGALAKGLEEGAKLEPGAAPPAVGGGAPALGAGPPPPLGAAGPPVPLGTAPPPPGAGLLGAGVPVLLGAAPPGPLGDGPPGPLGDGPPVLLRVGLPVPLGTGPLLLGAAPPELLGAAAELGAAGAYGASPELAVRRSKGAASEGSLKYRALACPAGVVGVGKPWPLAASCTAAAAARAADHTRGPGVGSRLSAAQAEPTAVRSRGKGPRIAAVSAREAPCRPLTAPSVTPSV